MRSVLKSSNNYVKRPKRPTMKKARVNLIYSRKTITEVDMAMN